MARCLLAPLPLLWAASRAAEHGRSPWRTGVLAGIATLPMWLFEHQWVAQMSALGLGPMGLVLSVYPGVFCWALICLLRRVWSSCDLARGARLDERGVPAWVVAL